MVPPTATPNIALGEVGQPEQRASRKYIVHRIDTTEATIIPVGLASKVGAVTAAVFALVAAGTAVLHGDHSQETIAAGAVAAVTVWTFMAGRFAQAYALYRDRPR
jgi:hypothetical protein